ncbi:MAG: hypothetical protein J6Y28_02995 [Acholeplasmatales bacterium]|nr:hypothetical protein [Acholeplasmatales bacterium]
MFVLKVGWKKRLIVGLLNIIPMITLVTFFLIICINKKVFDGVAVAFVCSIVFMLGVPELIFFEKDKTRRLDYVARKEETEYKQSPIGILIRTTMFAIVLLYFILVLVFKK